jgi:signal transduction histidine kinase
VDITARIGLIKKTGLFRGVPEGQLEEIASAYTEVRLKHGEKLFEENSTDEAMFLILSGELIVSKGLRQIARLGPGQYLGEMSLIESKPRSASACSAGETVLLKITREQFNKHLADNPGTLAEILRTLSSRIRHDLEIMSNDLLQLRMFTHDIKNHLTPLGYIEMYMEEVIAGMRGSGSSQKPRKGLDDAQNICTILKTSMDDLLALINQSLKRAKRIKVQHIKTPTPLRPLIENTITAMLCHKNLQGKRVHLQPGGENLQAKINSLDIQRVLQNLIINAGYASPDNGAVDLTLWQENGEIRISVTDHGAGIPEHIRPYLLKNEVTTKPEGNGLGLLACKDIIENHHQGKLWFESVVGQGTTFHCSIPQAESDENDDQGSLSIVQI